MSGLRPRSTTTWRGLLRDHATCPEALANCRLHGQKWSPSSVRWAITCRPFRWVVTRPASRSTVMCWETKFLTAGLPSRSRKGSG